MGEAEQYLHLRTRQMVVFLMGMILVGLALTAVGFASTADAIDVIPSALVGGAVYLLSLVTVTFAWGMDSGFWRRVYRRVGVFDEDSTPPLDEWRDDLEERGAFGPTDGDYRHVRADGGDRQ